MDDTWQRNEPDSPCVKICVMHHEVGLCIGCYRSLDEISNWAQMSAAERSVLIAELPGRAPKLVGKRRGRRVRRDKADN